MSLKLSDDQVYGILEVADELFQAGAYNDLARHIRAVSNLRKHLRNLVIDDKIEPLNSTPNVD